MLDYRACDIIASRLYIWWLVSFVGDDPKCLTYHVTFNHWPVSQLLRFSRPTSFTQLADSGLDAICWFRNMPKILFPSIYCTPNKVNRISINHLRFKQCSDSHWPKQVLMIRWWGHSCTVASSELFSRMVPCFTRFTKFTFTCVIPECHEFVMPGG